jgi:hypothetical protein
MCQLKLRSVEESLNNIPFIKEVKKSFGVKVSNALSFRCVCALERMDEETADLLTKTQGTKILK